MAIAFDSMGRQKTRRGWMTTLRTILPVAESILVTVPIGAAGGAGLRLVWADGSPAAVASGSPVARMRQQKRMEMFTKATRNDYTSLPKG